MTTPTIAIIAGASVVPELYAPLQSAFETKGYPTVVTEPPSITTADATTVLVDTDVEYVRLSVLAPLLAEGKDVVLLLHSYGGAYGAAAAQGVSKKERLEKGEKGGVVGIVYAASFVVEPGQNALEALALTDLAGSGVVPGEKPGTLIFTSAAVLWPSLSPEEGAERIAKMKPCSVSAIATATSILYAPYQDPAYEGKIAFIGMEDDRLVTAERKKAYLETSGITLVKNLKGGHGIDLENAEEVADAVVGFVEGFGK
ncbi:hypothetical protein K505DRAFT_321763 [Melanomma pulvis-pyrius CBS 109.77]|uniref:AB hydrolase-1 domain-containing protein n=1 Tax=Melanomma pulvis-pyrius CBS 109.77 TaxID=1314802 RepID=A0A6A6XRE5_9PLEO|nr:hypothetical protein K505DRAFT_321763 [Melanomma pulvis-pyrius CBS 109.77]